MTNFCEIHGLFVPLYNISKSKQRGLVFQYWSSIFFFFGIPSSIPIESSVSGGGPGDV